MEKRIGKGISRRKALTALAAAPAAMGISAPAVAQGNPGVNWRMTSSFPKALVGIDTAATVFTTRVREATDGKFNIQTFLPGELVPPLQALDAAQDGTVECAFTASYYYTGKSPAFAFGCQLPFGLNTRQHQAWVLTGGGGELLDEFFSQYNVRNIMLGTTAAQMGGWFRKEINNLDDLRGLKFRVGGLGGEILSRLGVIPQQIAPGDTYQALERGTIDAVEMISAIDDEKLGYVDVAKYYYYPGWWEGGTVTNLFINRDKWDELPETYQAIVHAAAAEATQRCLAVYDGQSLDALRRLVARGAQLRPFSQDIMDACFRITNETLDELAQANADFRKMYEPWKKFRADISTWFSIAETPLDTYLQRALKG